MIPIEYGKYYHIYNRGINGTKIFKEKDDYEHFFNLMSIYLESIADIYAYAALGNHFHFAIRIKKENEIGFLNPHYAKNEDMDLKWRTFFPKNEREKREKEYNKKPIPEKMLQHFFSSYAKGFNEKYMRTGALWEHPFDRLLVNNETYLKRLILYIHNNPVKHGFCESANDYPWTSYLSLVSVKPTKLSRNTVLGWFDSKANFKSLHKGHDDFDDINFLFLE